MKNCSFVGSEILLTTIGLQIFNKIKYALGSAWTGVFESVIPERDSFHFSEVVKKVVRLFEVVGSIGMKENSFCLL